MDSAACTRRGFLSAILRDVAEHVADAVEQVTAPVRESAAAVIESQPLLPPGAGSLEEFRTLCTRCDACIVACPARAIHKAGPELGGHSAYPLMTPWETPCTLCPTTPCIEVCKPGALNPAAPASFRIGKAVVRAESCLAHQRQPCDYCVTRCPLGRAAIRFDSGGLPDVLDGCTGCGQCSWLCPGNAIDIVAVA